eukprot:ANDGO_03736.mRNA.1 NAD-dependent protein deacetylase Sirt2
MQGLLDSGRFHAVHPRTDCPHVLPPSRSVANLGDHEVVIYPSPCEVCGDSSENWFCCACHSIQCSRYVNSHMALHAESSPQHSIVISFSDLSCYCYACDDYITSPQLDSLRSAVYQAKFGTVSGSEASQGESASHALPSAISSTPTAAETEYSNSSTSDGGTSSSGSAVSNELQSEGQNSHAFLSSETTVESEDPQMDAFEAAICGLSLSSLSRTPSRNVDVTNLDPDMVRLARELVSGRYRNVLCLVGAGVSVACGIPDFRSPGTGLYDNLQKYNLPEPTAVFSIDYFRENPFPFYMLARELMPGQYHPSHAHFFMKLLEEKGVLRRVYSQNIDDLEHLAGVSPGRLVQAHGTFQQCACIDCERQMDIEEFKSRLGVDSTTRKTISCVGCGGLVKPSIVFFGESLPEKFFANLSEDLRACDLMIIMGTSLTVAPVCHLVHKIRDDVPRLVFNRDSLARHLAAAPSAQFSFSEWIRSPSPKPNRDFQFLGDLQDRIREFAVACSWDRELDRLAQKPSLPSSSVPQP